MKNRAFTLFLSLLICLAAISPSYAQEAKGKEEVVYANLDNEGNIRNEYIVSILEADRGAKILDYGSYSAVRNMTTSDPIDYDKKKGVSKIDGADGRLYLEGKVKQPVLPWNIKIIYLLDDKKISAEELAGKSGKLKIKLNISENEEVESSFFNTYGLQITMNLDTTKAENIKADGAVSANVGIEKRLTYTILPKKGKNIEVSADVVDFEMNEISINGVRLDIDVEVDDDKIKDKVDEAKRLSQDFDMSADELRRGGGKIADGALNLYEKSKLLKRSSEKLNRGARDLAKGLSAISSNSGKLRRGAREAFSGLCKSVETVLNDKLRAAGIKKVAINPQNYERTLLGVMRQMKADKIYRKAYATIRKEVVKKVDKNEKKLYMQAVKKNSERIYMAYVKSREEDVYKAFIKQNESRFYREAAKLNLIRKLKEKGMNDDEAASYLETSQGKLMLTNIINSMTDSEKIAVLTQARKSLTEQQKAAILQGAVEKLTPEQKARILEAAVKSLSIEQKKRIKQLYIDDVMASEKVVKKLSEAVAKAGSQAKQVAVLKGRLDGFKAFCRGVESYTCSVDFAAKAADRIEKGSSLLSRYLKKFEQGIHVLSRGAGKLHMGLVKMYGGIHGFISRLSSMSAKIAEEIESNISQLLGKGEKVISFASEKNGEIKSLQFAIKINKIEKKSKQ